MERKNLIWLVLLTTFLIMGVWTQAAEAKPEFFMQIPDSYAEKNCTVCHIAPPVLNGFGLEFRSILQETDGDAALAFQKLETVEPKGSEEVASPSTGTMELVVLGEVHRGEQVELQATLLDNSGKPVSGAIISFDVPASLFIDTDMHITQARTNANGQATIRYTPKLEGDIKVLARTEGDLNNQPVGAAVNMSLEKGIALYNTDWKVKAPFVSAWLIILLLAVIWSAYVVAAKQVILIRQEGLLLEQYPLEEVEEKISVS